MEQKTNETASTNYVVNLKSLNHNFKNINLLVHVLNDKVVVIPNCVTVVAL